ncbi:dipeptidase PepV [Solibacillus merdavium]|uniref:Dipeptidase PepV n=1 Tax=Solibacillus merdavium TaxID=2762218 RepID=A0ABR8XRZ2_9BACL|nr:dipeptidase PepV [Solibacillus merdavium]MBD8034709.1 dipeptidase PepV [Solibacillus merdavium]
MDWLQMAKAREQELIQELQQLIQIESVKDENNFSDIIPFGVGPKAALDFMLQKGIEQGMITKNIDNMAGHIEMGQGEEIVGVLCHVDVVPAGDLQNWTYPPFEGQVVEGKLFGRGAIDDKGPTMAAWLAMKLIHDAKIPLTKRVRMIIGTDEESGFQCVTRYFEKEDMPTVGFAPDADFPLINAEKGIAHLSFSSKEKYSSDEQLTSFYAGKRTNMVPDEATAILKYADTDLSGNFQKFLKENGVEGTFTKAENGIIIVVKGKSAHAMEPEKGKNAAVYLTKFLQSVVTTKQSKAFVDFIVSVFDKDHFGAALELDYEDSMSGPTTLNPGIVKFDKHGASIEVSMRYSVSYPFEEKITRVQSLLQHELFTLDVVSNSNPHYVSEEDNLVQTLLQVYRKYSNDYSKPLSTGGGTYARVMKKGVAFGMLFPGEADVAHQADEFVDIENLIKATAIYAEAIVNLATN